MVSLEGMGIGALVVLVGFVVLWFARDLARFGELIDAVGSTTDSAEVEPADWNVGVTASIGLFVMLVGATIFVLALLS